MPTPSVLVRGVLYEWEWPQQGAGAMARHRGLWPIGRAVTQEDVPNMHESATPIGIQVLSDKSWIIAPGLVTEAGGSFERVDESRRPLSTPNLKKLSIWEAHLQTFTGC